MKTLHIIMPMAGEGSRFKNQGIDTPKPLIKANGIEFFKRALNSIIEPMFGDHIKCTFIVRHEHITEYHIDDEINRLFPNIETHVIYVDKTTRGATETCLLAKPFIGENESIILMDCDLQWHAKEYCDAIQKVLTGEDTKTKGILLSFHSSEPRYSYAQTNENGMVVETAEKKPISNHALIGAYFFADSLDFIRVAHKLIDENEVSTIKEYYVSLLFNYLIREHKDVRVYDVNTFASFGTPEELDAFTKNNFEES